MVNRSMLIRDMESHIRYNCLSDHSFQEYRGIRLVEYEPITEPDLVYAGECENLARLLISGKVEEGCILFASGESERLRNAPHRNITVIATDLSLIALYNHLAEIFLQVDMLKALIETHENKDTRHFLKTFSRQNGISLFFLSEEYRPLIRCVQPDDKELFPEHFMNPGQRARDVLFGMLSEMEKLGDDTAVITERQNGYIFGLIPVSRKSSVRGYLFACSNGRKSILRNILFVLAPVCYDMLEKDEAESQGEDSFQVLAMQFLGDQPGDMEKLEMRLRHLKNPPKKFKRSIVIRFVDEDGKVPPLHPQNLRKLFQELHRFFPNDHMALINECIYIMTSEEILDTALHIQDAEKFEELLCQYRAFAMVSNASYNLKGVRILATQCYQVLPIAVAVRINEEKDKHLLTFERYAPYYIIHLCHKSAAEEMGSDDIIYLCHPAINILTRYDRAYHQNLRDTLFSYLMNDRSIARTSEKMFIHRNTAIYKLNKIQELISDALDNPYTRHQLILSCMIIRYIEEYQHASFHLPPLYGSRNI